MTRLWKSLFYSLVVTFVALFGASSSWAQSGNIIKVEIGKTTLLQVAERPEVIFIANPAIVDIVIERGGVMFLVGRQTGETNMRMLDGDGGTLMNAAVVVVPQEARNLTLTRGGRETTFSCNPRCSGVPNPHASGANVGGRNADVTSESAGSGGTGAAQQSDIAATAAAAAAAAAAATASQQDTSKKTSAPARKPFVQ
jgi:hypothetical protein